MGKHKKPFDHDARLDQAVKRYKAKEAAGTLNTEKRIVPPLPRLEATSPDLSEWDNVLPISSHPRWSWKGLRGL